MREPLIDQGLGIDYWGLIIGDWLLGIGIPSGIQGRGRAEVRVGMRMRMRMDEDDEDEELPLLR